MNQLSLIPTPSLTPAASTAPRTHRETREQRIVLVTVPRPRSRAGRCLYFFDAEPLREFTAADIAALTGLAQPDADLGLNALRTKGLIDCRRLRPSTYGTGFYMRAHQLVIQFPTGGETP